MTLGGVVRVVGGALSTLAGIGVQVVRHENCVWVGLEVLVAVGLGVLGIELGRHLTGPPPARSV